MQKKYKAGGYLRLSDKDLHLDYHEQSESIENQKAMIESYAREHPEIELVDFFIDDGYTGLNYDRDGFRELMDCIDEGKINMIITKELSRLGRENLETLKLFKQDFVKKKVRYVALVDHIDFNGKIDDLALPFKVLINDEYSRGISNSVTNTIRTLQKQGKYVAAFTPYGYKRDPENKHHLIVDEEAAYVVKKIYHYYIEGRSINWICRKLSEDREIAPSIYKQQFTNYKANKTLPTTTYWTHTSVWRILKNEVYLGTVVQHTKEKLAYNLPNFQKVPEDEVIRIPDMHEPIILQEEFDTVQQMMKTRRRDWKMNEKNPNLFAGLIVCGECGRSMGRIQDHDYPKWYYRCNTYAKMGKEYCSSQKIYETQLQEIVLEAVKKNVIETDVFQNTKWNPEELYGQKREKNRRALGKAQERLEKLERERSSMVLKLSKDVLTEQDFRLYKEEYEKEKEQLQHKISDLQKQIKDDSIVNRKYQEWVDEFIVHKELKSLSREIAVNLIEKIVVYENRVIEIRFRFKNPLK